jgi:type III secretion protein HrpB1
MNIDKLVIGGLIEVVSLSQQIDFKSGAIDSDDVEMVISALRVVCPKAQEIDALEGMLWMSRGKWDEAILTLQSLIGKKPNFSYAKGLLALALFSKGDMSWRQVAADLEASSPTEDTKNLIRSIEARADLRDALKAYEKTGQFVLPESCAEQMRALEQAKQKGEQTEQPGANIPFADHANFIRL